MGLEAGIARTGYDGAQKDGLEIAAVIGQVTVGLAKGGHDLRHLQPEHAVGVGEGGAVALRVAFVALGGMGSDLDALSGQRHAVAAVPHDARHPEAAAADLCDDGGAGTIVVGPPRTPGIGTSVRDRTGLTSPDSVVAASALQVATKWRRVNGAGGMAVSPAGRGAVRRAFRPRPCGIIARCQSFPIRGRRRGGKGRSQLREARRLWSIR